MDAKTILESILESNQNALDLPGIPFNQEAQCTPHPRNVRRFVREIGALPVRERKKAYRDRQEQIRDLASDLKRTGWKAWRKPASFGLTVAGAAWTLKTGDPIGAFLAAIGAIVGAVGEQPKQVSRSAPLRLFPRPTSRGIR